ncbi:extracellular solute-binding protein [Marispirochaeta aestuarii]|uniref:extracellular solute-binding protein n=1 Tax=Marispirochaeta aestuarii TaxID=1963862 RepID=UPI0037490D4A
MQPRDKPSPSGQPLTQESRATELENIARMYEQANPGVKVEITVMPWSGAFDKMIAAIMAGNPPDIATVWAGLAAESCRFRRYRYR